MLAFGEEMLARIRAHNPSRIVVGYSGGMDSHVLLHLAVRALPLPVCALHVNHGLSQQADAWQEHCEATARALGADFVARRVSVSTVGSIEENARHVRYEVFAGFLQPDDLLLLAHHADDQVETALLSLFRGSARPGLAGMPVERALDESWLVRPMLDWRRKDVEAYAARHELGWIEDESNLDPGFDRNYIRHQVLDVIRARWPDVEARLADAISRDEEFLQLVDSIADSDLGALRGGHGGLSLSGLSRLPPPRRHNVVRSWVSGYGLPLPSSALLLRGLDSMIEARDDAAPLLTWQGICIRRFNGSIYLTDQIDVRGEHYESSLELDETVLPFGRISANAAKGRGMRRSLVADAVVRFREGGERLRVEFQHRTLKNLFQEQGVPTWLRDHMPLIYLGEDLVAIAGLPSWDIPMLTSSAVAASDDDEGVELSLLVHNQPYS